MVSAGFKTIRLICIGSAAAGFWLFLLIWADFTWFQWFGRLEWSLVDLGIFEVVLVNSIGFVRFFLNSSCLDGSGQISIDSIGFVICIDLGWLEWITVDLEDRYKLIFVGFGRFRWIRLGMAIYLDGSGRFGWLWAALIGFGRIWLDLVGFGWVWTSNFEWICLDLVGYKRI